jgi:hypothetical protein
MGSLQCDMMTCAGGTVVWQCRPPRFQCKLLICRGHISVRHSLGMNASCATICSRSLLLLCLLIGTVQEYRDEAMRHRLMLHFLNGTEEEAGELRRGHTNCM